MKTALPGTRIISIHPVKKKNVTDPATDFPMNFGETVAFPTIAASESEIVKTSTAGMAIFFSNIKKVTVADINK